jgi:hypothetical protein
MFFEAFLVRMYFTEAMIKVSRAPKEQTTKLVSAMPVSTNRSKTVDIPAHQVENRESIKIKQKTCVMMLK